MIIRDRDDLLRPPEAAFVSGIAVKAVDRAIDEHVLRRGSTFSTAAAGSRPVPA